MPFRLFALVALAAALCFRHSNAENDAGKMTRYYAKHGVQVSAIQKLLDLEYSDSEVRKFASRGMKEGPGSLPGVPQWWGELSAVKPTMSLEEEVQVGLRVAGRLMSDFKPVDDQKAQTYLNLLGGYVTSKSMRPRLQYRFAILEAKDPMAYSTPGGFVFVSTGLVKLLETEDELAFVLAHEAVHVARFHGVKGVENATAVRHSNDALTDLEVESNTAQNDRKELEDVTSKAYKKFMNYTRSIEKERASGNSNDAFDDLDRTVQKGGQLDQEDEELDLDVFADHSYRVGTGFRNRTEEFESDILGTDIIVRSGYSNEASASLLDKLRVAMGDTPFVLDDATHPRFADRIKSVKKHIAERWGRSNRRMVHTGSRFEQFKKSLN